MQKNKQKLLYVLDIMKETDESNPITANQIVGRLRTYGIDTERKSVLRDISALSEYGFDIVLHSDNKLGYYMASRDFEDWELKILYDSVLSASFLTQSETKSLADRICSLSSAAGRKNLRAVTPIRFKNKSKDPAVKIFIDTVMKAIRTNHMVTFQYIFTDIDLERKLKRNGFLYSVSPYAVYRSGSSYYMIGNTDGYDNLSCYRFDRMKNLICCDCRAHPAEEILGKNPDIMLSEYVQNTVYNFSGEKITLQMLVKHCAIDDLLDFFGDKLKISSSIDKLLATVRTTQSEGLYRWLMEYSETVTAISPESVVTEMQRRTKAAAGAYNAIFCEYKG